MRTAIIGHTGFVGSTLQKAYPDAECYNSKNIDDLCGVFAHIFIAGLPGVKWYANQHPVEDRLSITKLKRGLRQVDNVVIKTKIVLISTIDVYDRTIGVNESTPINKARLLDAGNHYGFNRLHFEEWVTATFGQIHTTILRLPGLFGDGLKKNPIYDLLTGNNPKFSEEDHYQWYPTENLADDVDRYSDAGQHLVNLVTAPISMRNVARVISQGLGAPADYEPTGTKANYGVQSLFTKRADADYHLEWWEVAEHLKDYVSRVKERGTP